MDTNIQSFLDKKKRVDQFFYDYFSQKTWLEFDSTRISQIRWVEFRLGHRRLLSIQRRRINRDLFPSKIHQNSLSNLKGRKYSGLLTNSAILGIKRAFEKMLVYSEPFDAYEFKTEKTRSAIMVAWTFTLPAGYGPLCGKTMNQLFSTLLENLHSRFPIHKYLWKQEYTKQGVPHIHFDVNVFLDYDYVYNAWDTVLRDQPFYQRFLTANPQYDKNSPDYNEKKKSNIAFFTPLWTDSQCTNYLNNYLKKMSQNRMPVDGKVWSQSTGLRDVQLPILKFDNNQRKLLHNAKDKEKIKSFNVDLNSYLVDNDGIIDSVPHRTSTLATVWKPIGKNDILNVLTTFNRNLLINYRTNSRNCIVSKIDTFLLSDRRVIYESFNSIINSNQLDLEVYSKETTKPHKELCNSIISRSAHNHIYYSKVQFKNHDI